MRNLFTTEEEKTVFHLRRILDALDAPINAGTMLLDLGCGNGNLVHEFRKNGIQAFGADLQDALKSTGNRSNEANVSVSSDDVLKAISLSEGYRVPFPNEYFDLIISIEVFEHVQDHSKVFSEIHRMLKPAGCSLHIFPGRFSPLEVHTKVPLAGVFQDYSYLRLWSMLGIRNIFQKGWSAEETARANVQWLHLNTNYLPRKEILKKAEFYFQESRFVEGLFMKHSPGRPGAIYPFIKAFGVGPHLFGQVRKTVLFTRGKKKRDSSKPRQ